MKIVDYSNLVLGRAASKTAKLLLSGESVVIVNAEKAVIRGTKTGVMEKFVRRYGHRAKGNPTTHGPNMSRLPDRLVYWTIQHMLPYRQARGRNALKLLKIHLGMPKRFENKDTQNWKDTVNMEKKNFFTMQQVSEEMGLHKRGL